MKIKTEENMLKGGIFTISQNDLEIMSNEFAEINNILALAKADDGVKRILLIEVIREFGEDIIDILNRLPIINDKKLDTVIDGVLDVANEEYTIEGYHNSDTYVIVQIPEKRKNDLKEWAKRILIG